VKDSNDMYNDAPSLIFKKSMWSIFICLRAYLSLEAAIGRRRRQSPMPALHLTPMPI